MAFLNSLKKILESVGKNNKPTYAVMAVATANGIFKPISSLTDKKESLQSRKYAALREFATEVVAVPTYWACGVGAATLGAKLYKDEPQKKVMARTNFMFLGVCTAALLVIPAVCSAGLLILDKYFKNKSNNNLSTSTVVNKNNYNNTKTYKDLYTKFGHLYHPNINYFGNGGGLKI